MSSDVNLVMGPHVIEALGQVSIVSQGDGVFVRSGPGSSGLRLMSETHVGLSCGASMLAMAAKGPGEGDVVLTPGKRGEARIMAGVPGIGPQIKIAPDSLKLSMGLPGVGPSITLSEDSIVFAVGAVSFKMTATGIEEVVAAVARKASPTGHALTAAESSLKVEVQGITSECPLLKEQVSGVSQFKATLAQSTVDGMVKDHAGITMLG